MEYQNVFHDACHSIYKWLRLGMQKTKFIPAIYYWGLGNDNITQTVNTHEITLRYISIL